MKLEQVPKGFRDIYQGVADEPIENPQILIRSGTGTQSIKVVDDKTVELTVNGDAGVGENTQFAVQVDGHIGDGEADVVVEFDYDTISPDATTLTFGTRIRREPIPTT